ncbi:MAG: ATP-binding protein [Chloroflexi bacterium]|nr:ATP-binding protein [Chloroflexota bacterium]
MTRAAPLPVYHSVIRAGSSTLHIACSTLIPNTGLVGGGRIPRPGEITLSHRGVLFLDELPEFGHTILETLRQPIEDKVVTTSRAQGTVSYPANFMLIGAMNPCPCGFYGDPLKECTCSPTQVSRYSKRISGPMLDRIDIFVEVPRVDYEKLSAPSNAESSAEVRRRAQAARDIQLYRFRDIRSEDNRDIEEGVTIDLDADGHLVGLEILDAAKRFGIDSVSKVRIENLSIAKS